MKLISFDIKKGLLFDNGTTVVDEHRQDCCESVYADWDQLKDTDVLSHDFQEDLIIEGVEDSGFRLEGYFIPCYNEQNGYYSDELEILIKKPGNKTKTIDISDFVEDKIN